MNTRREFLACLAGLAVGPALAQVERFERRGPPQQVIVLGAGLAGMCAAYELQSQGHKVSVLEAQLRPGGRVRTLREPFAPGLYVEAGAENIPGAHELTQHYARAFGLRLVPNTVPGTRNFYHVRGQRILPDDKTVWPFELTPEERQLGLQGLFRQYIEVATQQSQEAGLGPQTLRALSALDAHTLGAWLRSRGASPGAAELLALGFGMELGSAASFLLHRLNSMGGAMNFRIEGGNDRLPEEFARRVEIRYGAPVVGVTQDDQHVKVAIGSAGGTDTLTADRVVCALPCPVIGKIFQDARLSKAKQKAIREQHYSRTAKVFLQTRTRFWLKDRLSGYVTTDLPIERLTPDPGADAGVRGALTAYPIGPYTSALEKMREEERVAAALGQAKQIFPELSTAFEGGVAYCWGLDSWQRGSFALHTPGQLGFIETLAAAEGRIHFAGEHTSLWTGWMQGALESGRRVVREING
ncbi:MAG TPA: NAD(P)/FAD-dependent oxidoreductase [Myxococcaceae bacterium]|jgi:monoamine oxidase